mmetsp:Transcript_10503/g.34523  ORF Transcript_10503/g.34523 Transcript_10503/m.34523 type:complete len:232 (-) Transcript_10503:1243-1938(-)
MEGGVRGDAQDAADRQRNPAQNDERAALCRLQYLARKCHGAAQGEEGGGGAPVGADDARGATHAQPTLAAPLLGVARQCSGGEGAQDQAREGGAAHAEARGCWGVQQVVRTHRGEARASGQDDARRQVYAKVGHGGCIPAVARGGARDAARGAPPAPGAAHAGGAARRHPAAPPTSLGRLQRVFQASRLYDAEQGGQGFAQKDAPRHGQARAHPRGLPPNLRRAQQYRRRS